MRLRQHNCIHHERRTRMAQQLATVVNSWTLPTLAPFVLNNAPPALVAAPSNFSSFNPSLIVSEGADAETQSLLIFFRVSNMHFCPGLPARTSWRDSMRLQTHIRSYLAAAELDALTFEPRAAATVLREASSLFRTEGEACAARIDAGVGVHGTFSGPEDPRAFWSPTSPHPKLLVPAWTDNCSRLRMHIVTLPHSVAGGGSVGRVGSEPSHVALFVDEWPARATMPDPETEPIQKNWLPFVHGGTVWLEYSIEPRVVLLVNEASGRCVPVLPRCAAAAAGRRDCPTTHALFPSFPPLARLAAEYGRVSGGAPPVHLREHGAYLGLAHVKESRRAPEDIGTARMVYRHVFYAFEDSPPFAVIAAGVPRTLPQSDGRAPTVQFAAGMALDRTGTQLIVSYSVHDCGVQLARLQLDAVLRDVGLLW